MVYGVPISWFIDESVHVAACWERNEPLRQLTECDDRIDVWRISHKLNNTRLYERMLNFRVSRWRLHIDKMHKNKFHLL